MTFYRANDGSYQVDRRNSARTRVDVPARLQTTGGDWSGRLSDFSETGARMLLGNPPRAGTQALLKCGSDEIFCKVAWAVDDACGLNFDRPVPRTLVLEIAGHDDNSPTSVAKLDRIPVGKKRSALSHSSLGQIRVDPPEAADEPAPVSAGELGRMQPAAASFESRGDDGYIKFYDFRAMANP